MPRIVKGLNQIHVYVGTERETLTCEEALGLASQLLVEVREVMAAHTKEVIADAERVIAEASGR